MGKEIRLFEKSNTPHEGMSASVSARAPGLRRICTGFVPKNETVHRLYNLAMGLILLVITLPVMLLISLALFVTQGPKVLHFGERLGRDRRPFNIMKFRTLDTISAKELTKDKVLPKNSGIETPLGKYLRASRLDELPQIFNIIKGDMNICGPRPVRRAIADIETLHNPDYAVRFRVKSGLIGPVQAFMSHGASKRLRAKYNYILCNSQLNYRGELTLLVQVGASVVRKAITEAFKRLRIGTGAKAAARVASRWRLNLRDAVSGEDMPVMAFSEDRIVLMARPRLPLPAPLFLVLHVSPKGLRKARITLQEIGPVDGGYAYAYKAQTVGAQYLIDRYLLKNAVVAPVPPSAVPSYTRRRPTSVSSDAEHVPAE